MTGAVVVTTTTATREEARRIAEALLGRKLAACVQMTAAETRYVWKGKVEAAEETLLAIKTLAGLYPRVEAAIREMNSYELPEVTATPIVEGSSAYLDWIAAEAAGA